MMATDPADMNGLVSAAGGVSWTGMPAGTAMGHVHLHVGDIEQGAAFYSTALGFDRMVWSYPGALFLAAGGYHHHLGTNTWAGAGVGFTASETAGFFFGARFVSARAGAIAASNHNPATDPLRKIIMRGKRLLGLRDRHLHQLRLPLFLHKIE